MISLQRSKEILPEGNLPKKRKWDDDDDNDPSPTDETSKKPDKIKSIKPDSVNSNPQTQFPLEWQRCLDIKSGQIYFYNTRTDKRALGEAKSSLETYNPAPMSLELELNLPYQSMGNNIQVDDNNDKYKKHDDSSTTSSIYPNINHFKNFNTIKGLTKSPSWLTLEADEQEMVTAVCKKCYMLVMMSKSFPACPNCKFLHPSGLSLNVFDRD